MSTCSGGRFGKWRGRGCARGFSEATTPRTGALIVPPDRVLLGPRRRHGARTHGRSERKGMKCDDFLLSLLFKRVFVGVCLTCFESCISHVPKAAEACENNNGKTCVPWRRNRHQMGLCLCTRLVCKKIKQIQIQSNKSNHIGLLPTFRCDSFQTSNI